MITAILAVLTYAAALGQEPPQLLQAFASNEACATEAAKANTQYAKELLENNAVVVCLEIKKPSV